MNKPVIQLYEYNIWANDRVVDHLQSLPDEVFGQEVNMGFKSIAAVLRHLVSADEVWFERMKEGAGGLAPVAGDPYASAEEARLAMSALQSRIRKFLIAATDLDKIVTYKNAAGQQFQNSIAEIVQQTVNHGTYHRGNITTILRHLGHSGAQTDYIIYLRR
ncbi:DinB family protein [Paenibacillus ginsengarvi]|uniref:DUF664 domain-containing protein n=1 Tax=Paenibacillus ginsengarvi TaxID=400777 RepID=A0A3B0CF93_9BACL|nr:DinB family protein [Paenibacillus ginsengarvi]RKN84293.1 DUF664 domain-containing protein [Paenibacillus ginsengarvi]